MSCVSIRLMWLHCKRQSSLNKRLIELGEHIIVLAAGRQIPGAVTPVDDKS